MLDLWTTRHVIQEAMKLGEAIKTARNDEHQPRLSMPRAHSPVDHSDARLLASWGRLLK